MTLPQIAAAYLVLAVPLALLFWCACAAGARRDGAGR